jgi:hypothetical protein
VAKKRRPEPDDDELAEAADPLGKLLSKYEVSLAGLLVVCGVFALVGGVLTAIGLARRPVSLTFLIIGGAVLLIAVALLVMNVFNVGRRLELRKRGLRFVESGVETELFWDEIADVAVNRTDDTYLGIASIERRSSDAVSPSGPLTKTEWDVTIHGPRGRSIRLSPIFLRTVPDPKKLIARIRMCARLR